MDTIPKAESRKRGRPSSGGRLPLIGVRIHPDDLARVDSWIDAQPAKPSRPEAVRRLMKKGLDQS